jgi:hypothetical protein
MSTAIPVCNQMLLTGIDDILDLFSLGRYSWTIVRRTRGPATTIALMDEINMKAMISPEMVVKIGGRK